MKKLIVLTCLFFAGCGKTFLPQMESRELIINKYLIIGYDGPKHVYIDLKNLDTGEVLNRIYVSKHFNNHRKQLIVGRELTLTNEIVTWTGGNKTKSFLNLRENLDKEF